MFIVNEKYVLTEDLGDEIWLKKDAIITCTHIDEKADSNMYFFAHPLFVYINGGTFTIDKEETIVLLSDYYKNSGYSVSGDSKSVTFIVSGREITASITTIRRKVDSISVHYKYFVTENTTIKVIGEGYSGENKVPELEDIIKLFRNN